MVFESPRAVCELQDLKEGAICAPMPGFCDVGSVNMAAAAGLAAGIQWLETHGVPNEACALANRLAVALGQRPFCEVYGGAAARRTATVSLRIDGVGPAEAEARLAARGIVVRGGEHCAPMALQAIGAPEGTLRISFGPFHGARDLEQILTAVDALAA